MKLLMTKIILGLTLIFIGYWIADGFRPVHPSAPINLEAFGKLPVLENGRVKPMDTVARNTLLILRGKQSTKVAPTDEFPKGRKFTALQWLYHRMFNPEFAATIETFRIDEPELVSLLGYKPDEKIHFSFNELLPHFPELDRQRGMIGSDLEASEMSRFQRALVKLYENLGLYLGLGATLGNPMPNDSLRGITLTDEIKAYEAMLRELPNDPMQLQTRLEGKQGQAQAMVMTLMNVFRERAQTNAIKIIPRPNSSEWDTAWDSLFASFPTDTVDPIVEHYALLADSARAGDIQGFNRAVALLDVDKWERLPNERINGVNTEFAFNAYNAFGRAMTLYVLAFVLIAIWWATGGETLGKVAILMALGAFIIHTGGLGTRMFIEGRPPVTNLYSSAVFIGWGAVLMSLLMERFFGRGLGVAVGSAVGFGTLIVAHHLSLGGDTMEAMRAVLDSNFWLGTHVVTITLGYAAMFFAGFIAVVYLLLTMFTPFADRNFGKIAEGMVFGVMCFALLFSTVGTILGGIWADQSWGRFWGWDPKENGALLIVVWTALVLHAFGCKLARRRGLMALAVMGNIVTSWSWFGTNMLGIGLHSYGFMDEAFQALLMFWLSQITLIALTYAVPLKWWWSKEAIGPRPSGA